MVTAGFAVLAPGPHPGGVTSATGDSAVAIPLFLLGIGWNLTLVSGSALVASEATGGSGARLQGASDAVVWTAAALASTSSSFMVVLAAYAALSLIGAGLAVLLAIAIAMDSRSSRVVPA